MEALKTSTEPRGTFHSILAHDCLVEECLHAEFEDIFQHFDVMDGPCSEVSDR